MKEIAKLHITMLENGSVSVSGPLSNKAQCYAMIELARDAIKDHCDELEAEAKSRIAAPSARDIAAVGGRLS